MSSPLCMVVHERRYQNEMPDYGEDTNENSAMAILIAVLTMLSVALFVMGGGSVGGNIRGYSTVETPPEKNEVPKEVLKRKVGLPSPIVKPLAE